MSGRNTVAGEPRLDPRVIFESEAMIMAKRENGHLATADVPPTAKKRERKKAVRWPVRLQRQREDVSGFFWEDVDGLSGDGFPDADVALRFAKASNIEGTYRAIRPADRYDYDSWMPMPPAPKG